MRKLLREIRNFPIILTPSIWVLRSLKRIGIPIGSSIYKHFPYHGLIKVDIPGGSTFNTYSRGTHIENGLYWEGIGSYEKGSMGIWAYLARQSSEVLDIGANTGVFSLVAWSCGAKSIHAFEPINRIYMHLKSIFELNDEGILKAWNFAVSNEKGMLNLYDPGGQYPTSASLSIDFIEANNTITQYVETKVSVIDIDQFCCENGLHKVDLIKLDVEGHELKALEGMHATILNFKPWILIEVLDGYEDDIKHFFESKCTGLYRWCRINENDGKANRNVILIPKLRCPEQLPPEIKQYVFLDES